MKVRADRDDTLEVQSPDGPGFCVRSDATKAIWWFCKTAEEGFLYIRRVLAGEEWVETARR